MEAAAKLHHRHQPLPLSLYHHIPSFTRPISSLPFRTPPPSHSSSVKFSLSIKSQSSSTSPSSSDCHYRSNPKPPKPQFTEPPNPAPLSLLKIITVAAVTSAAVFFARLNLKPLNAVAILPPMPAETAVRRDLDDYAISNPDDVEALKRLMESKIKNRKVDEAIAIVKELIRQEPDDYEWRLLKSHFHLYNQDLDLAKLGFNEVLEKEPFMVEAYHGLVTVASQGDSESELKELEKRIEDAMERCKREKGGDDLRDFKLLIAEIRVIEGNLIEALRLYQELEKEDPNDFRSYLCQGIIYTMLRKKDEAEKQFEKYQRLVPEGHPYNEYFDKVFREKMENERASSRS
ncbi:protein SLOW GREEN 1, chloroplastic-like [Actinidia eriantha]|uniref:protein SLOW GREEN 1, chloroplastic-like n=1 Tax=Actinidia eriantha TaxID=165200 RepID=UPI0025855B4E|nr:protein SLOW GREEN 1, chloroplastic-like [Actinidia eriantha]